MDVVPKDANENNTEFKNATELMADLTLQLGDTGYNLIDIAMAKKDDKEEEWQMKLFLILIVLFFLLWSSFPRMISALLIMMIIGLS